MKWALVTSPIDHEDDVVTTRQRLRRIAELLGLSPRDQVRMATAVFEIARNAHRHAGSGKIEYGIEQSDEEYSLVARVSDQGPGILNLTAILDGKFAGLGQGIVGARRLVDGFDIWSGSTGTVVTLAKALPSNSEALTDPKIAYLTQAINQATSDDLRIAMREQNNDLLQSLSELAEREEEAQKLNRELAETNRGVVALYAELEAQASQLRNAGLNLERQVKARTFELAKANARLRAEAAEREQMESDLRQSQKMDAVGQLTGGLAHDFNNLLTGIVGSLDMMQKRMAKGQTQNLSRYMEGAMSSANRAAALTHRLLAFARRQPLDPKPTNANVLLNGMADLLRSTISQTIKLRISTADPLWLTLCDPHQLENAVLNLAINARDAMPDGGVLTIDTYNGHRPDVTNVMPNEYVCVRVTDTGVGMSPDVIARAFDPFFTTKPMGQGTGLGLSMIYGFARQSNGHARIVSEVGQGTSIFLYLPRYDGETEAAAAVHQTKDMDRGSGEIVLVVEDEAVVRTMIVEVLSDLGYRTIEAHDGNAGLNRLDSLQHVDLLLTDVGMPGLNGRQLADHARTTRPDLPVIFMTGYAETLMSASEALDKGMAIITKPFTMEALSERVRAMLETPGFFDDPTQVSPSTNDAQSQFESRRVGPRCAIFPLR